MSRNFDFSRHMMRTDECRFLHVKILLYRPVLVVLLSSNGTPVATCSSTDPIQTILRQSMLQQISNHCIQAAQDLTHLIYGSLMSGDVVLPAWWYNVFCESTTSGDCRAIWEFIERLLIIPRPIYDRNDFCRSETLSVTCAGSRRPKVARMLEHVPARSFKI